MSRTLSLVAFSSLLLATAVEAYAGSARDADGYRDATNQPPVVATRLVASNVAASLEGDNCGVAGYPWLNVDGQLING